MKNKMIMEDYMDVSIIRPFYLEENNNVIGMSFSMHLPNYIDGVLNLDTNDLAM